MSDGTLLGFIGVGVSAMESFEEAAKELKLAAMAIEKFEKSNQRG